MSSSSSTPAAVPPPPAVAEEGMLSLKLSQTHSSYGCWCQVRGTEFTWSSSGTGGTAGDSLSPITAVKQLHDLPVLSKENTMQNPFDRHDLLVSGRQRSTGAFLSIKVRVPYPKMRYRWVAAMEAAIPNAAAAAAATATASAPRGVPDEHRRTVSYRAAVKRVATSPQFLEAVKRGVKDSPWVSYLDMNTMATYYYNRETRETTWINPEAEPRATEGEEGGGEDVQGEDEGGEAAAAASAAAQEPVEEAAAADEPASAAALDDHSEARMNERLDLMTRWLMQQTIAQEFDTLLLLSKHGALTSSEDGADPMSTFAASTFLGSLYRNIISCPLFDQKSHDGKRQLRRVFNDFISFLPEFDARYGAAHNDPKGIKKEVLTITANPVYHMSRTRWKVPNSAPPLPSEAGAPTVDSHLFEDDMLDQKMVVRAIINLMKVAFEDERQGQGADGGGVDWLLGAFVTANRVDELPDAWQQLLAAMAPTSLFKIWKSLERPSSSSSFRNYYNNLPRSAIVEAVRWKLVDGGVAGSLINLLLKTRFAGGPTTLQQLVSSQLRLQEHDYTISYWTDLLRPQVKRRVDAERAKGGALYPASLREGTQSAREFLASLKSGYRQGFTIHDLSLEFEADGPFCSMEEQARVQAQALQEIVENEIAKVEKSGLVALYADEKFIALIELVLTVLIEPFAELLCRPEVGAAEVLDDVFEAWKRVIDVGSLCKDGPTAAKPESKLAGYADAIDDLQASVFRLVKQAVVFDYHKWRDILKWLAELLRNSRLDLGVQEMIAGSPPPAGGADAGEGGALGGLQKPVQAAVWREVDGLLQKCSQGRATYQAGALYTSRLEVTEKVVLPVFIERTNELLSRREQQLQKLGAARNGPARRGDSPEPYRRDGGEADAAPFDDEPIERTDSALWYLGVVKDAAIEGLSSSGTGSAVRTAGVHAAVLALHNFTRCDVKGLSQPAADAASAAGQLSAFMSSMNEALLGTSSNGKPPEYSPRGDISKDVSVWALSGSRPKGSEELKPIVDIALAGLAEEQNSAHLLLSGYTVVDIPLTASGLRLWYRRGNGKPIKAVHVGALPLERSSLELLASVQKSSQTAALADGSVAAQAAQYGSAMNRLIGSLREVGGDLRTLKVISPESGEVREPTGPGATISRGGGGISANGTGNSTAKGRYTSAELRVVICR